MADKEVNLRITADTARAQRGVGEVAAEIEKLAASLGGELGAQAQQAAAKLRALGEQEAAVKNFLSLQTQVGASERALKQLTGEADRYAAQIGAAGPPTEKEAAQLERLRAAAGDAAASLARQQGQLQSSAAAMQRVGVATEGASRTLKRIQADIRQTAQDVGELDPRLQAVTQGWRGAGEAADNAAQRHVALAGAFKTLAASMAGLFAANKMLAFARDSIAVADAYGQMDERIRMATRSEQERELVQQRLLASANTTYRALSEQQELYIRTADALRSMGYETSAVLDITDSFTYLLATNAASADKGAAAIDAYTKSIQSGRVESESWQTLLAATPTLVDAIAKVTGKTTEQVRQLGITGQLSVASLNEGLRQTVEANKVATEGMVTTVGDAMKRLSNTWSAYIGEANKATGATAGIVKLIDTLTSNLDGVISVAVRAGEVLAVMAGARALSALMAYVTQLGVATAGTVALTGATTGMAGALARAQVAMQGLAAASKGLVLAALAVEIANVGLALARWHEQSGKAQAAQAALDGTSARLAARLAEVSAQTGVNVTSMKELDAAVAAGALHFDQATQKWVAGADAQQRLAAATAEGGKSAGEAALLYGQLGEGYQLVQSYLTSQIDLSQKELASTKARGEAAIAEAKLLGDEGALRKAIGDAAAAEASALAALAARRQQELDTLRQQLKDKQAVLDQSPVVTQAQRDEMKALEELIATKQVDVDTTRAQAAVASVNAKATGEQVQATQAATSAAQASAISKNADAQAAVSLLQTQKGLLAQGEQMARLMGDENLARHYRIEQMQIDVKITLAKANAMQVEAEGSINVARAKMEELRVAGALTPVKEAELNASIKLAQAKIKEAGATRDMAALMQNAADAARMYGDAAGKAGRKSKDATDAAAQGWDETAAAAQRAAAEAKKYDDYMASRFERGWAKDTDGKTVVAREDPALRNQRLAALYGEDMVGNANAEAAYNLKKRIDMLTANAGSLVGGDGSLGLLRKELERLTAAMEADRAAKQKPDRPAAAPAAPERTSGAGRSGGVSSGVASVVRVELPRGERYDVDTTTASGREQLNALIARIGADKRRAA